eukprot:Gb_20938 [translate_table: standard]
MANSESTLEKYGDAQMVSYSHPAVFADLLIVVGLSSDTIPTMARVDLDASRLFVEFERVQFDGIPFSGVKERSAHYFTKASKDADMDRFSRAMKKRSTLKLLMELYFVGVIEDANFFINIIKDLTSTEHFRDRDTTQMHLSLLVSFAQGKLRRKQAAHLISILEAEKREERRIFQFVRLDGTLNQNEEEGQQKGRNKLVGVKLGAASREVLTWAEDGNLMVSNASDCRGVINPDENAEALALTWDHRVAREDEREQIKNLVNDQRAGDLAKPFCVEK